MIPLRQSTQSSCPTAKTVRTDNTRRRERVAGVWRTLYNLGWTLGELLGFLICRAVRGVLDVVFRFVFDARVAGQQFYAEVFAGEDTAARGTREADGKLPGEVHQLRLLEDALARRDQSRSRGGTAERDRRGGIRSLRFTGGEPLLRTDLFEIM